MKKMGIIEHIIKPLDLKQATTHETPAEYGTLGSDKDGESGELMFNYKSTFGTLGYLDHTRPDIKFAVSQHPIFSNTLKKSHEVAVKRIGHYLPGTITKGLMLKPSKPLKIDCYVVVDFVRLWSYENIQDPACVKSRTWCMICVADCPGISKLQIETKNQLAYILTKGLGTEQLKHIRNLLMGW